MAYIVMAYVVMANVEYLLYEQMVALWPLQVWPIHLIVFAYTITADRGYSCVLYSYGPYSLQL